VGLVPLSTGFRTLVLSCGDLGVEVSNALAADGVSEIVGLITAPYAIRQRSLPATIRNTIRKEGWPGLIAAFRGKVQTVARRSEPASVSSSDPKLAPGIEHIHVSNFHAQECISAINRLRPDLAVVAGTYILNESVFDLPRHGSINLHSGKVPEYRGASPGFWELYNGETAVGITIHRVVTAVDAGAVLAQELFPLNPAPDIDPLVYLEQFKHAVLRPNGVRMLVNTVRSLAQGTSREIPQDPTAGRTFSTPDYHTVRELRRRVLERRNSGAIR
jgi:methionyl-tRNA formyltransferase